MASPSALPLIQYHATLVAPAWGPYSEPLELEGNDLRVRHVDLREELGEPWRLAIEVTTNHPQFDASRLAGSAFTLHMLREDAANPAENDGRFFHGVVSTAEYIGAFSDAYHARLLVTSALGLLENTRRSRVFQDASVVEIVQEVTAEVLSSRGTEVDVSRLARDTSTRDYCVQYQESDLLFLQRILAEEGITVGFEADESHERVVLFDDQDRFGSVLRSVEGLGASPPPQHIHVRGEQIEEESIASFTWQHRVYAGHGEHEQWDWKQASPGQLHASTEPKEASPQHVGSFYTHGGRRLQEDAGGAGPHLDNTADRLSRAYNLRALEANVFDGSSNVLSLFPGATFELDGHPDTELNGAYYCIRVAHEADNADVELGAHSSGSNYANRFLCASLRQAFAPQEFPHPRIFGVQTATVVGPSGEEIHTDVHGRIQVRMHWDREQRARDTDTSCWLRVAHSWAGAGFGTQFIPRVGMEVLVSFLGGDPDRPVCVGSVYSGSHTPPYSLLHNKTQSGIKTRSSPGGDGFNELRFEDAAGKEEVYFHAQRNHTERVLHAHAQRVGATQSVSVGGNQTLSVGGERAVNVTGNQTIKVGAPPPPDGQGEVTPSDHLLSVTGSITQKADNSVEITAPNKIILRCGASSIELTPGGITVIAGGDTQLMLGAGPGNETASTPFALTTPSPHVALTMDDQGLMTMSSEKGGTIAMDSEIRLTSVSQSNVTIAEGIDLKAKGDASVKLTTDVAIKGGTVLAQGTLASLSVSTSIEGDGDSVEISSEQRRFRTRTDRRVRLAQGREDGRGREGPRQHRRPQREDQLSRWNPSGLPSKACSRPWRASCARPRRSCCTWTRRCACASRASRP